jgi:hypothetical protein
MGNDVYGSNAIIKSEDPPTPSLEFTTQTEIQPALSGSINCADYAVATSAMALNQPCTHVNFSHIFWDFCHYASNFMAFCFVSFDK